MPTSSSSLALQLIDAVAIAIAHGYILARARLTSHPSSVLRLAAARDEVAYQPVAKVSLGVLWRDGDGATVLAVTVI